MLGAAEALVWMPGWIAQFEILLAVFTDGHVFFPYA
jgi:hypothetical protein